jgi:aspartate/methionine/tyrosine aminotransferase
MAERTVKIGSAGKIFALTGWKVGWTIASAELTAMLARAHQYLTFTVASNLQAAIAHGLARTDDYFEAAPAAFARSRDRLAAGLLAEGFRVLPSQGTYFLNVDLGASGVAMDDKSFCLHAVRTARIAAIPICAFYEDQPVTHIMRLCFAKADATLDLGVERLARARDLAARSG